MQFSGQCCGFFYLLMVALCNRADDIYFHPDVCSFFLLFSSPNLSGWRLDVSCVSYFHTWCGLSANLECRSEMCCTVHAARWKCRTQKIAKIRRLGTIAHLCRAISSQLRHISIIGKKLLSSIGISANSKDFGFEKPDSTAYYTQCVKFS